MKPDFWFTFLAIGLTAFFQAVSSEADPPAQDLNPAETAPLTPAVPETEARPGAEEDSVNLQIRDGLRAFQLGRWEEARDAFRQVVASEPTNASALVNLGLCELRLGEYEQAEAAFADAVKYDPDMAAAWIHLGIARFHSGDDPGAVAAFANGLYLQPGHSRARNYYAATLTRKGWLHGAEAELRRAIELEPDYPEAHYNLALLYMRRTPPAGELARRHYQRAVDLGATPDRDLEASLRDVLNP